MEIYPNPAENEFQLKLPSVLAGQTVQIAVHRIDGSICLAQTLPYGQTIKLPDGFASGVYFVRAQTPVAIFNGKLLLK
jgi:hypothetical protein